MKLGIPTLVVIGFLVLAALQGVSTLWMTANHNAQLKAQTEVFNAQLKAQTEVQNAQLVALTERFHAQLVAQAAEFRKK